ncbi:Coenzyme F420 hydrogenase/dehydrogenase, beta subunit C-terminal domain [Leisingera sp. ANG-Vp]|uniref:Coenzyme F420 hydrogenase/dehydrogenase, beta subunit C-terminal domain n=1 Tax=Leisingera sp. ANG-Vp TaxID=1577896 RepID=UPI00068AC90E|nr:Coenzyme F420 hydrogenase/dehydrogenase, beta subunit C-terminal domain [Leisingera sp. ANG-Vp]
MSQSHSQKISKPMTPAERLNRITEDAMCIGCGLCQSVAGPDTVRMELVETGYERPVVRGDLCHETVDRIMDLCPGTRVEGLPEAAQDAGTRHDLVWGAYQQMALAYAADPEVRHAGSTGGVLTALGMFLVETGEVDFILHARASDRVPTFGDRTVSETAAAVLAGAGSRYGPTAPLIDVLEQLDKGRPFAFVGKPCDIAALRNLARVDMRVNELVKYMLTPVCGGFMPPQGMSRFLEQDLGLDPEQVTGFRYRGYGCPGPTRVEMRDGTVVEKRYTDFWGTDESMWVLPFRCKVCPDGIGESADIAASDTWPGGSPDPETEDDDPGTNAIVVRSARGADLVRRAAEAGYLTVTDEVDPRYMDSVQPHQRNKKYAAGARFEGLRAEGKTVPRTARLRLDALMADLGSEDAAFQRDGTRERVRIGKASEPTPKPKD